MHTCRVTFSILFITVTHTQWFWIKYSKMYSVFFFHPVHEDVLKTDSDRVVQHNSRDRKRCSAAYILKCSVKLKHNSYLFILSIRDAGFKWLPVTLTLNMSKLFINVILFSDDPPSDSEIEKNTDGLWDRLKHQALRFHQSLQRWLCFVSSSRSGAESDGGEPSDSVRRRDRLIQEKRTVEVISVLLIAQAVNIFRDSFLAVFLPHFKHMHGRFIEH